MGPTRICIMLIWKVSLSIIRPTSQEPYVQGKKGVRGDGSEANASALEVEVDRWARVAKHEPMQVNFHTPAWLSGSYT